MLLTLCVLLFTQPSHSAPTDHYDRAAIEKWLNGNIPRGEGHPVKNAFPTGNKIKFCAGAGCKIKIPYEFTEAQLRSAAETMELARREKNCTANNAQCERLALVYALRFLDKAVRDTRLKSISMDEVVRFSINKDNGNDPANFADKLGQGQQLLRDCVDQAANGSAYLVVLANRGLVKHHRVVAPGMVNNGPFPHFFTQLRELEGGKHLFHMDMYRQPRTDFEKLASVGQRD